MTYYYLHFSKPQYFFPKGFKNHKVFLSFFIPYSVKGKISYYLFLKFSWYRFLFRKKNIEEFIPEKKIRKIINGEALMVFNTGTEGPNQKITGIGYQKNGKYFFFKYAHSTISKKNLLNEHFILNKLKALDFVPKIQYFHKGDNQFLLKTDLLTGEKLKNISINKLILNCLFELSNQTVIFKNQTNSNLKFTFAHGDFCPWNMMKKNNKILLFDWEMGGNYPLGYDLFTFIFQTSFLLNKKNSIQNIFDKNSKYIKIYFSHFNIKNWEPYLIAFAEGKIIDGSININKGIIKKYKKLLKYAKKA